MENNIKRLFQWFGLVILCLVTLINVQYKWEWKNPLFSNSFLFTVRFIGEKYLIAGSEGKLFVSEDGNTWGQGFPRTIRDLTCFAYGKGRFVCA